MKFYVVKDKEIIEEHEYNDNDELFAAGIIDSIYNEGKKVELN